MILGAALGFLAGAVVVGLLGWRGDKHRREEERFVSAFSRVGALLDVQHFYDLHVVDGGKPAVFQRWLEEELDDAREERDRV